MYTLLLIEIYSHILFIDNVQCLTCRYLRPTDIVPIILIIFLLFFFPTEAHILFSMVLISLIWGLLCLFIKCLFFKILITLVSMFPHSSWCLSNVLHHFLKGTLFFYNEPWYRKTIFFLIITVGSRLFLISSYHIIKITTTVISNWISLIYQT